ncbi:hypothetical protein EVAR_30490_1 [Eumeta japonica]|uniref:Uncharacterized protein n=1 Tax=Eumeta variegata TaxID=151549 RepID=A0A4C1VWM4_EUMVA|nr:hypothetical protein EVAR_30490_1 [Eumeta japonica]
MDIVPAHNERWKLVDCDFKSCRPTFECTSSREYVGSGSEYCRRAAAHQPLRKPHYNPRASETIPYRWFNEFKGGQVTLAEKKEVAALRRLLQKKTCWR